MPFVSLHHKVLVKTVRTIYMILEYYSVKSFISSKIKNGILQLLRSIFSYHLESQKLQTRDTIGNHVSVMKMYSHPFIIQQRSDSCQLCLCCYVDHFICAPKKPQFYFLFLVFSYRPTNILLYLLSMELLDVWNILIYM